MAAPDSPRAAATATRLGLGSPGDPWSQPWRHFLLLYLAHLCDIADFEETHFGHVEARLALEKLVDDANDLLTLLRRRR